LGEIFVIKITKMSLNLISMAVDEEKINVKGSLTGLEDVLI